jgi:aminoglycoside 6'-N-acetyltransferase I
LNPVIRAALPGDQAEWIRMRLELWPDGSAADHLREMAEHLASPADNAVLVAARSTGGLAGFVEVGTRPYAEGCKTSPVGYIEGWFVDEDVRRQGIGRLLIAAAEAWARSLGLSEMGSDAVLGNEVSHAAHLALGYQDQAPIGPYIKRLDDRPAE